MPGDYSRKTFNRKKHYSGVLMQQGRVQLDSDWNEQLAIQLYRTQTEATDVIGQSGVPKKNDGFKIGKTADGHDLTIAPGRIYVEGLLCELDQAATYTNQPYFPNPEEFTAPLTSPPSSPPGSPLQLDLDDGTYLVFLDAWQREITALDDRLIREVALGGPDTATRVQNVFQVKLLQVDQSSPPGEITCKTPLDLEPLGTGTLKARTQPVPDQENPCLLPPSAGYTRLENQLYRVEIHTGGSRDQARFKWSRDNASVETKITNIDDDVVTVEDLGKDDVLGFAGNQWVELVDDESALKGTPQALVQIKKIDVAALEITMKTSVGTLANRPGLKLRRWDQSGNNANASGVGASLANWIDLEGGIQVQFSSTGQYRAGDYWLIPARTATGEIEWPPYQIPNTNPSAEPPKGVRHHFCRLALIEVKGGIVSVKEDCRKKFPTLTEICAEDICFDNDNCKLADADTVQEAIDRLCAERDLRFHNKHLHGWGIVCGLQVECGPDPLGQQRRHVTVRKGYAIDCEGNDIILEKDDRVDLIGLIEDTLTSPPASPPGNLADTEVCLVLDSSPNAETRYHVEPYPKPKNKREALLKGTLLMDFLTECIESLSDFFREQFTPQPGEEKEPVGPTQKRITTFSNLLIQLTNRENGAFVFLSGEKGQSGKNLEDTILRDFYTKLRAKLQSHTFCAMFEDARQFPEYPFSGLDIATIFSKGFQTRVRVAPNSAVAYSVGATNKINVFDLNKNEMVDELEFPGGSGVIVRDVAFSRDGQQLYAVATGNNKDSMFAVIDVSGLRHTFRKPSMICDILVVTLATSPSTSENVYAIGKGKGLYEVNPLAVEDKPTPKYAFNASGHLVVIDRLGLAFATANDPAGSADRYDRVRRLNLRAVENPKDFVTAAQDATGAIVFTPGEDDIAVSLQGNSAKLYAVSVLSSVQSDKQVAVYNALDTAATPTPITITELGENTTIRLEHNPVTNHVMESYEDSYRVGLINPDNRLVSNYRHPVQISPLSIAVAPDQKRTYVLNYASNTISSIPSEMFVPSRQIPLPPLVNYRADVLNAFADLVGGLLQYLKDCFCDHLLVDCPECGPDDKLYLACISIRNGQVFKVCNFSLRKYVHSFPTIEYWLSVVPIIPLIKSAVEKFCCAALPNFFGRFNAPRPEPPTAGAGKNRLRSTQIRSGVTFAQQTDFRAAVSDLTSRVRTGRPVLGDFLSTTGSRILVPEANTVRHTDVSGQTVGDAKTRLEAAGVVVDKVEAYDPALGGPNLAEFTTAPVRLERGSRVKLITRDDRVLFFARAAEPPPAVDDLRIQIEAARRDVDENKAVSTATKTEIQELRSQVERASATIERATPQIEDLRAKVGTNTNEILTTKTSVSDALRMRDEMTSLKNELDQLRQTHQQELAARDREIAALKSTTREFQTTIQSVTDLRSEVDRLSGVRPSPTPKPRLKKKPRKEE